MPCPANAASPCTSTGRYFALPPSPARSCLARVRPTVTGSTASTPAPYLPRERGVAVHQHRQILRLAAFAGAILLGASASYGHRIHRFQVAGIRRQVDMDFLSALGDVFAGRAHVVLHVARPQYAAWIHILKFRKCLLRRAPC